MSSKSRLIYDKGDHRPISIVYHPNSKSVVAGTREGKIFVINPKNTSENQEMQISNGNLEYLTNFDQDGLIVSGDDIKILNSSFKEINTFKPHEDATIGVAYNGKMFYSASEDSKVMESDKAGKTKKLLYQHESPIISFDYNKSKNLIATSCSDSELIIFDIEKNTKVNKTLDYKVWSLKFNLEGDLLIAGDHEGCLTVYKTLDLKIHQGPESIHESRVKHLALSPDGNYIATSSFDTKVRVFKIKDLEKVDTFESHNDWVRSATFDSESQFVYSCGDDGKIFENKIPALPERQPAGLGGNFYIYLMLFMLFMFFLSSAYFLLKSGPAETSQSLVNNTSEQFDPNPVNLSNGGNTQGVDLLNETLESDSNSTTLKENTSSNRTDEPSNEIETKTSNEFKNSETQQEFTSNKEEELKDKENNQDGQEVTLNKENHQDGQEDTLNKENNQDGQEVTLNKNQHQNDQPQPINDL